MKVQMNWNGYAVGECALLGGAALLWAQSPALAKVFLATGLFTLGAQVCIGRTRLKNNTAKPIYCKDEETDEVRVCNPYDEIYDIDGFAWGGKVYKVRDGMWVSVSDKGGVLFESIISWIGSKALGATLDTPPDYGWEKIFKYR